MVTENQEKVTEKGKFGPHASPISGRFSCRDIGYLLALASWYKPLTKLPILRQPSVITRHLETAEQGSASYVCFVFTSVHLRLSISHTQRHTIELVK